MTHSGSHRARVSAAEYLGDFDDHAAKAAYPVSDARDARHVAIPILFHSSQGRSLFGITASAAAMSSGSAAGSDENLCSTGRDCPVNSMASCKELRASASSISRSGL